MTTLASANRRLTTLVAVAVTGAAAFLWLRQPLLASPLPTAPSPAEASTENVEVPAPVPAKAVGPDSHLERESVADDPVAAIDLVVELEAPLLRCRHVPLVITETNERLQTVMRHRTRTDLDGRVTVARATCRSSDRRGVVCVDLEFPSSGAHAMQIEPDTDSVALWSPPRGRLQVEVREANGDLLLTEAIAQVRVVAATPPADRVHAIAIRRGTGSILLEAGELQLEVVVASHDGRQVAPIQVTGPALEGELATCTVRLPARPMFRLSLRDTAGKPMAATAIEFFCARLPASMPPRGRTDARGVVEFPAPANARVGELVPLVVTASMPNGELLYGTLATELHARAAGSLGELTMQVCDQLAAGCCVDADGQPMAGLRLLLLGERAAGERVELFGERQWRSRTIQQVVTHDNGKFRILGPPQGRRLQLREAGHSKGLATFVEGTTDLRITVPPARPRGLFQ